MDTKNIDHYSGFEGEPEIQFMSISKNNEKIILHIWGGYFNSIMDSIEASKEGWKGLAYFYHLHEGWYEEDLWQIKDIDAAIKEFKEINRANFQPQEHKILENILDLLTTSKIEN